MMKKISVASVYNNYDTDEDFDEYAVIPVSKIYGKHYQYVSHSGEQKDGRMSKPATAPKINFFKNVNATDDDIITINVAGKRFQTFRGTLEQFPDTLLGDPVKRARFFLASRKEYFFDRHRKSFDAILYFYQSGGVLRRPRFIAIDTFVHELLFFELGPKVMDDFWHQEGYTKPVKPELPNTKWKRRVWQLMEHPDSSTAARCVGLFSLFIILISTVIFCIETLPELREQRMSMFNVTRYEELDILSGHTDAFAIVELFCISWFTLEFLLRFASCPNRITFAKTMLNWIDFAAIAPFYIKLAFSNSTMSFAVLRVLRLVRVFRIFKLSRHSRGLRILFETFKASFRELCLLIFLIMIAMILFSSVIYYAEQDVEGNQFSSIPQGFWYSLVTMTTVGYGDITPKGVPGRIVGMLCALIGVLVIALPVPVIVENFKHYYRQEQRLSLMLEVHESQNIANNENHNQIQNHVTESGNDGRNAAGSDHVSMSSASL